MALYPAHPNLIIELFCSDHYIKASYYYPYVYSLYIGSISRASH